MMSVCIYCGKDKLIALEECESCSRRPESHNDVIYSIILSFSETEPHLNFLTIDKIEEIRKDVLQGYPINVKDDVFMLAEEAYSAARIVDSPQLIKYFTNTDMTAPILFGALVILVISFVMGR